MTISAQAGKFALNLASMMILARLLAPKDFGLVAMVTAVTNFFALFKDMGLSTATIQREEITHEQISNLFWINVVVSAAITVLTFTAAPLLAAFYGDPRLKLITIIIAPMFLLGGLAVQHHALLIRQMRFGAIAAIDIGSLFVAVLAAVVAAGLGAGYWALVVMQLAMAGANVVAVWIACPWKPGPPSRRSGVWPMLGFGGELTGFGVINYIASNIDKVLIGKVSGEVPLGHYERAYKLLLTPIQQINAPVAAVAVPALSRLVKEPKRYRAAYLRVVEKLAMVSMPAAAFLVIAADWLVRVLLGPQWDEAGRIFGVLSISVLTMSIANSTGWLFVSQGRSRDMLMWGVLRLLMVIVFVSVGLHWGPMGVAVSLSFSSVCVRFPVVAWIVGRKGPVKAADLFAAVAPSFIASLCAFAILGAYRFLAAPENPLIGIGVSFGLAVGVTALVLLFIPAGRAALRDAIEMAAPVVGRESGDLLHWLKTPGRPFKRFVQNLRYYRQRKTLRFRRKFLYALTPPPNSQNVGDHAQAVAIRRWLAKHFPQIPVIEVDKDEARYYLRALRRLIQPDDVVFIQGAGGLGDLSLRSESLRRMLIAKFPWNRIISLPQTIQFTDTPRGMREKQKTAEVYNRHPDLTILTRDPESESIARAMFDKARVLCVPDFMLSLPPRDPTPQNDPARVLLCLRDDDQSAMTPNELKALQERLPYPSGFANTYVDRLIPREQQESVLEETLDLFSSYDVIVTDRLHGLIFGILCRKACVVLPTLDHKLTAAMAWFRDLPQVVLAEASENVPECVVRLLALDERPLPDWNAAYFDRLPEQLGLNDG